MQISNYGASAKARQTQQTGQTRQNRSTFGFGAAVQSELQKDQVNISQAGRGAVQAGVLSASEKTFFNDSFGMNVFGVDSAKGPVLGNQAAKVLDSQEINYFQDTFADSSQISSYSRNGFGNMAQARIGSALNMQA